MGGPSSRGEPTDKPDSVVGDHLSGATVADGLVRPTRDVSDGPSCPCLALLLTGFAEPMRSPAPLVGSYPTVSPLPAARAEARRRRRSALCCTVRRITPPGRYPASCPVESGLSSTVETAAIASSTHRGQRTPCSEFAPPVLGRRGSPMVGSNVNVAGSPRRGRRPQSRTGGRRGRRRRGRRPPTRSLR